MDALNFFIFNDLKGACLKTILLISISYSGYFLKVLLSKRSLHMSSFHCHLCVKSFHSIYFVLIFITSLSCISNCQEFLYLKYNMNSLNFFFHKICSQSGRSIKDVIFKLNFKDHK